MNEAEIKSIIESRSKRIDCDIYWTNDEFHSPAVCFRVDLVCQPKYPLFVIGRYNPYAKALSFAIIAKNVGRIYALDLGKAHHNPNCEQVGRIHEHRWTEEHHDKFAVAPTDVTESISNPVGVWKQFCRKAGINHTGNIRNPLIQEELDL